MRNVENKDRLFVRFEQIRLVTLGLRFVWDANNRVYARSHTHYACAASSKILNDQT